MGNDNTASAQKGNRMLHMYTRLLNGEIINKKDEADRFGKSSRSIQSDIEDIRSFLADLTADGEIEKELVYDAKLNGYCLKTSDKRTLTNSEILAVCKILLGSRAFTKDEMSPIINKLLTCCVPPKNKRKVNDLISNELHHYTELNHHKRFVGSIWEIGEAVQRHLCMKIVYTRQDGITVERVVQPVGIMFSEFYFYLTAFIENIDKKTEFQNPDDNSPTIFRIDRIQSFEVLDRHFDIPYSDRFEEGEFRKRIQFMYGGRLRRIKFLYKGVNPEPVLDRLPTAKVIEKTDKGFVITAKVFGDGVDMWIRSQGDLVEMM
ncbi:MAG: WYL domain-containing protein [Prevotella sp.]|nr:WYL domain-containing protein [Prevotella sp.]